MEWLNTLLHNTYFIWCVMAIIIFALTQLVKLPIKHFTNKITNERARKIVNTTILLIPFALGVLFEFLWSTFYLKEAFSGIIGLGYGTTAISIYGIIERFFKIKIENPYDSEEGDVVKELVQNVAEDGKITKDDFALVEKFLKDIDVENCNEEVKEKLKSLVSDITKDGVIDKKEITAVEEFMDKVK